VGECFFWYRLTRVVPDQRPLNGRCSLFYASSHAVRTCGVVCGRACVGARVYCAKPAELQMIRFGGGGDSRYMSPRKHVGPCQLGVQISRRKGHSYCREWLPPASVRPLLRVRASFTHTQQFQRQTFLCCRLSCVDRLAVIPHIE